MKMKKDIGLIVEFDDEKYSYEETIFLYQRFFEILAIIGKQKIPENFVKRIFTEKWYDKQKP